MSWPVLDSACLRGFSALSAQGNTGMFGSVLTWVQYGCSTLLLSEGGVIE
jgi:hypothetical protein